MRGGHTALQTCDPHEPSLGGGGIWYQTPASQNRTFQRVVLSRGRAPCLDAVCPVDLLRRAQKFHFWEFPNLGVSNMVACNLYVEALLFCTLLRRFAFLLLRSFVLICVFLPPTVFRATTFGNSKLFIWTFTVKSEFQMSL